MPLALLLFLLLTIATPARGQSAETVTLSIVPSDNPIVTRFAAALDSSGAPFTLFIAPVMTITVEPLIPYIFFDSGSATIPERYVLFDSYEQTVTFDESELEGTIIEKYHHILNILGARMRRYPENKVVVRGAAPEREEGDTLGDARARSVYRYLRDVWRIPDSLFVLPGGGRRYLEFMYKNYPGVDRQATVTPHVPEHGSDDRLEREWELLGPLVDTVRVSILLPSFVTFTVSDTFADTDVRERWIEIRRKDTVWNRWVIASHSWERRASGVPSYAWTGGDGERLDGDDREIVVRFVTRLITGEEHRSADLMIPIVHIPPLLSDIVMGDAGSRIDLSYGIGVGSGHRLERLHSQILRLHVYPRIIDSSIVEVVAYDDSIGMSDRSIANSTQVAHNVGRGVVANAAVPLQYLRAHGLGESSQLHPHGLPEFIIYKRIVRIAIRSARASAYEPSD